MKCDVAVIGGGPAGAIAALVTARGGKKTLLIDGVAPSSFKIGESLPAGARNILRHLGIQNILENKAHLTSYGNGSCWGTDSLAMTDFIRDPYGLGLLLDRTEFDSGLREEAVRNKVSLLSHHVQAVRREDHQWVIEGDGLKVEAAEIIDATGRNSKVAKQIGVSRLQDDTLMAIYGWMKSDPHDKDHRTIIEATENGWWYTSKLAQGNRVVCFHSDSPQIGQWIRMPHLWQAALAQTKFVSKVMKETTPIEAFRVTPSWGSSLEQYAGDHWIAVGDAALSFDPISSQGIFNALYTGMKGAEAVLKTSWGDNNALPHYTQELKKIRSTYLRHHSIMYAAEQRWPQVPFWQSRHSKNLAFWAAVGSRHSRLPEMR